MAGYETGMRCRGGGRRAAFFALTLVLVGQIASAVAAETPFSPEERRRLARLTDLPAEGDLAAAKLEGVTFVSIGGARRVDFADADCALLARLPKLASVTLDGVEPTGACIDALPQSVTALRLVGVTLDAPALAALGRMTRLHDLWIEGGAGSTAHLADAFPPTSPLLRVKVGAVDGETLAALRRLPRLSELEVGAVLGPQGLAPLGGAPELERLSMENATAADLDTIADLPRLDTLVTGMDDDVREAQLRHLTRSKTLTSVSLSFSDRRGSTGVGVLADMPRLAHLGLVYQTVSDRELARLVRSRTLASLDLREADVSEAGLVGLLKSRSLKRVNLWRVVISDTVRRRLAKRFEID